MKPRSLRLTEAEARELQAAYQHCQNAKAKTRYQAVRLYGTGYTVVQIQDICGCLPRNLSNWTRAYQERGLPALLDHHLGGNRALLTPKQIEAVQTQLHRYTPAQLLGPDHSGPDHSGPDHSGPDHSGPDHLGPDHLGPDHLGPDHSGPDCWVGDGQFWNAADVARLLEREFGVVYKSLTSYRALLQKCGLSYQRPAKQYKSRSEAKIMDFEEQLEKKTGGHCPRRSAHGHSGGG